MAEWPSIRAEPQKLQIGRWRVDLPRLPTPARYMAVSRKRSGEPTPMGVAPRQSYCRAEKTTDPAGLVGTEPYAISAWRILPNPAVSPWKIRGNPLGKKRLSPQKSLRDGGFFRLFLAILRASDNLKVGGGIGPLRRFCTFHKLYVSAGAAWIAFRGAS
jgi:hypothetical protein